MDFFSAYVNPPKKEVGRYNSGECIVDKAGYRPVFREVADMIASGERFERARAFDYPDGDVDSSVRHVDLSGMDSFEVADYAKTVRQDIGKRIAAEQKLKADKAAAAQKERIIKEYEAAKAAKSAE